MGVDLTDVGHRRWQAVPKSSPPSVRRYMFPTARRVESPVRISDMNWMQVEAYLRGDDRAVLPLGSTEQHSYLRLTVDCILPEKVAVDAAEPLGIPVFPVLPYGVTPYFREFPGSVTLRVHRPKPGLHAWPLLFPSYGGAR